VGEGVAPVQYVYRTFKPLLSAAVPHEKVVAVLVACTPVVSSLPPSELMP
jgi:hypothetical protein